jgi:hypothetical protein
MQTVTAIQIVIASTDYAPQQSEVRTIADINGRVIKLDTPLRYVSLSLSLSWSVYLASAEFELTVWTGTCTGERSGTERAKIRSTSVPRFSLSLSLPLHGSVCVCVCGVCLTDRAGQVALLTRRFRFRGDTTDGESGQIDKRFGGHFFVRGGVFQLHGVEITDAGQVS